MKKNYENKINEIQNEKLNLENKIKLYENNKLKKEDDKFKYNNEFNKFKDNFDKIEIENQSIKNSITHAYLNIIEKYSLLYNELNKPKNFKIFEIKNNINNNNDNINNLREIIVEFEDIFLTLINIIKDYNKNIIQNELKLKDKNDVLKENDDLKNQIKNLSFLVQRNEILFKNKQNELINNYNNKIQNILKQNEEKYYNQINELNKGIKEKIEENEKIKNNYHFLYMQYKDLLQKNNIKIIEVK